LLPALEVGQSFCSNRDLIVKIKAHVFLKYQLGAGGLFGKFFLHTYTVRMYARRTGKLHMREAKRKGE
jgi:hypothetical protein